MVVSILQDTAARTAVTEENWKTRIALRCDRRALLCDATLRRPIRQTLSRSLPDLAVIAYQEVPADVLLEPAALLKLEDLVA